jgi:hypothetical protein
MPALLPLLAAEASRALPLVPPVDVLCIVVTRAAPSELALHAAAAIVQAAQTQLALAIHADY